MQLASFYGSVIFWLPCEDSKNPREKKDGPYAQDTYGELGRWSVKSAEKMSLHDRGTGCARVNVVVGVEESFPGLRTIKRNFHADHHDDYPIYPSLEGVIDAAISLARKPIKYYKDVVFNDENK